MSYQLDMKEIERQVYLSYSEDGLVDIAIGVVITAWGLMLMMKPTGLIGLIGLLGLGIWYIGKRTITIPRIGVIEPSPKMERRLTNLAVFLFVAGLVVFGGILLSRAAGNTLVSDYSLGILGLVLAAGVALLAYLLNAPRIYIYALILLVSFAGGEILDKSITTFDAFAFSVVLGGGLIMISGIVVLVRFLRKYPRPQMEA
ncbi:MAG: hypothetical protein ACK2UM_04000 [Anaerolineales bacterium]